MSAQYSGFDVGRRADTPNMPPADTRHPFTRPSQSDASSRTDDASHARKRHGNRLHVREVQTGKWAVRPRRNIYMPSHPKTCPNTPFAFALAEVDRTHPSWSASRRRSLGTPSSISSMHLLHGQPTRGSGEHEHERDSRDQQGCVHRPRRSQCSAKQTWRVSGRRWRRAGALQDDGGRHVRHGDDAGTIPPASTDALSSRRTQGSPRTLSLEELGCCHACLRSRYRLRPAGFVAGGVGMGLAP